MFSRFESRPECPAVLRRDRMPFVCGDTFAGKPGREFFPYVERITEHRGEIFGGGLSFAANEGVWEIHSYLLSGFHDQSTPNLGDCKSFHVEQPASRRASCSQLPLICSTWNTPVTCSQFRFRFHIGTASKKLPNLYPPQIVFHFSAGVARKIHKFLSRPKPFSQKRFPTQ